MINGQVFDWESITVSLPHGVLIGVKDISYDDERPVEPIYGKGSKPIGRGRGNYKAEGKLTVLREEFDKILDYARGKGVAFYQLPPFPITVSYANDGEPVRTDVLPECVFTKRSRKASQGNTELTVDLDFVILKPIRDNGVASL